MNYYDVEYTFPEKNGIVFTNPHNSKDTFEINVGWSYILSDFRGLGTNIKVIRIEPYTGDVDKPRNIYYRVYKDFTAPGTSYTKIVLGREEIFTPVDNISGTELMERRFLIEPLIFPPGTKITEGGRRSKKSKKTKSKKYKKARKSRRRVRS